MDSGIDRHKPVAGFDSGRTSVDARSAEPVCKRLLGAFEFGCALFSEFSIGYRR